MNGSYLFIVAFFVIFDLVTGYQTSPQKSEMSLKVVTYSLSGLKYSFTGSSIVLRAQV